MMRNWIGIACSNHVARGRAGGFMQLCHGKSAPLRRLRAGDRVVYYSPGVAFGSPATGANRCQSFTACGTVREGEPYRFDMGDGFVPHRREVEWDAQAHPAPIQPLLEMLALTRGQRNWGYVFRFGLVEIGDEDMAVIRQAMGAAPAPGAVQMSLFASGASMRGTMAL